MNAQLIDRGGAHVWTERFCGGNAPELVIFWLARTAAAQCTTGPPGRPSQARDFFDVLPSTSTEALVSNVQLGASALCSRRFCARIARRSPPIWRRAQGGHMTFLIRLGQNTAAVTFRRNEARAALEQVRDLRAQGLANVRVSEEHGAELSEADLIRRAGLAQAPQNAAVEPDLRVGVKHRHGMSAKT